MNEKRRKYLRNYYLSHKEKFIEQTKRWKENNCGKESIEWWKKYRHNYYLAHKKRIMRQVIEWKEITLKR